MQNLRMFKDKTAEFTGNELLKNFFKNKEPKELIKLYSVTGGVPKYIEMFSNGTDVFDSID